MEDNTLEDAGSINSRAGVREERWTSLDLRPLEFPSTVISSVKRATMIQNFEADFIRAMGIISPSAALHAQAVIAGVQRDLPVYRRRDVETTRKVLRIGPRERPRNSGTVAQKLRSTFNCRITQEWWDLARMLSLLLRHDLPVRLILMTAYHRLLPELIQYVKEPVAGDQGAVSTFQKLQLWKSAARRLRQMGGTLPGVTFLMTAFDEILTAFNLNNQRGNWLYQTERKKFPWWT